MSTQTQGRHYGTRGRVIKVTTNSFAITRLPLKTYTQYDVITPEVKSVEKRHRIIKQLQINIAPDVFNPMSLFDGKAILFASRPLSLAGGGSGTFNVYLSEAAPPPGSTRGIYSVKLMKSSGSTITPASVNNLISGGPASGDTITGINLIQLLIRQELNLSNPSNGRSYFTPDGHLTLRGGVELWRGYFQSVRPTLGRMLVNVDVSVSLVYQSGNMMDVAFSVLGIRDARALSISRSDPNFRKLENHVKKLLVKVRFNPRTKTIRGLQPEAGMYKFSKDGHETTVAQHYQDAYRIRIEYPRAPGVILTGKNAPHPVIVPMELVTILPGQLYKKKLPDPSNQNEVLKFSTLRPSERLNRIQNGVAGSASPVLQYSSSSYIIESGMTISPKPLTISGRVLDTPKMLYGLGSRHNELIPANGSWNMVSQKLRTSEQLTRWGVINFEPNFTQQMTTNFVNMLCDCCHTLGMHVEPWSYMGMGNGHSVERDLDLAGTAIFEKTRKAPRFILVILPSHAAEIRSRTKLWGDVSKGVATQCVKVDKLARANNQYGNNVALKINARLGGNNSAARTPTILKLQQAPFMIMGADVGHPGPGVNRPSVTSLVWSHDVDATRYVAFSGVQDPRTEMIQGLKLMVKNAVLAFGEKIKMAPRRVIFFRDGVSEGEYEQVCRIEIKDIEEAFAEVWAEKGIRDPLPLLTFLVVGKRHHIRFMPQQPQDADRSGNCPAGFVADNGLSSPNTFDFYLQSHGGLLGTSRPSHYIVLKDDNFASNVDDLQELSFALCHVYAKATRSVSIPAPVYYADLVCSRAIFYFDTQLNFADDSTVLSGSTPPFDLKKWKDGYHDIHSILNKSMYFL